MKKFGRGFVLDYAALMDEVHKPPEGDHNRAPCSSSGSVESTEGSPTSTEYTGWNSGSFGDGAGSPMDLASPTDEGSPDLSSNMKRMPSRMSVSRTGRCKNRDRQRLTVHHTEDFYRVPPPPPAVSKVTAPISSAANDRPNIGEGKQPGRESMTMGEAIDFDSSVNALGNSVQAPVMTDCYSF